MLVRACLAGDTTAYGLLVEKYSAPLFNAAYRITHSREDAGDAIQTAFVKAYEKLHTFDFGHRFFSWIYRIALNEALDLAGRNRRETDLAESPPLLADDPESEYAEAEQSRLVQEAVLALEPRLRVLVVLKHFQGLSYAAISEITGVPEKTVKSRLFSARQRLREVMEARGWLP